MSRRSLYNYLFFLIPLVYFLSLPIVGADLAVWIAHGKYFLQTGSILRQDIYSILPTTDLIYPFGSSVLYALIYSVAGLVGTSLFHKLAVLLISLIWYKSSLCGSQSPWSGMTKLVVLLSWFGCSLFFVDRPALLAMVPLLLSFLILQKAEDLSWKDLLLLNAVNILWVNLHGSWILLTLMYSWREFSRIAILRRDFKWGAWIGAGCLLLTSLFNPFGYKIFSYVLETARLSKERRFSEWGATSLTGTYQSQAIAYYLLLVLIIIFGVYLFKSNRAKARELLSSHFIILLFLGLTSIRNTSLAFFVLIPWASQFGLISRETEEKKSSAIIHRINAAVIAFVAFLLIAFLPSVKPLAEEFLPQNKRNVYDEYAPFLLANYLNQTTDIDPVFNEWEYGSFLILTQKHKIFADTRNIIYSSESVAEYLDVISGGNLWQTILNKYKVKYILLNAKLRPTLIDKIENSKNWEMVKVDNESVLYRRKG